MLQYPYFVVSQTNSVRYSHFEIYKCQRQISNLRSYTDTFSKSGTNTLELYTLTSVECEE